MAQHHIAAINASSEFELCACSDPDSTRAEILSPAVTSFPTIENMLHCVDLDVVIVATPNQLHVQHGIQVLESGAWLLIEKPAANSKQEFELLAQARTKNAGHCTVSLHAAFGLEIEWFVTQQAQSQSRFHSAITSFASRFYDPYFEDGQLLANAASLSGSWMDSGINALSVVGRLIEVDRLQISDSRITRVRKSGCSEVQGTVEYRFDEGGRPGYGSIDTNWTLGRNSKTTTLGFADSDSRIVLDHSAQRVLVQEGALKKVLFTGRNKYPRLTNHYIGVFEDLANQIRSGMDNFEYAKKLHDFVYVANDWPH